MRHHLKRYCIETTRVEQFLVNFVQGEDDFESDLLALACVKSIDLWSQKGEKRRK
jgi:hypothetical protein